MGRCLLSFDTSGRGLSVCVSDDGQILAQSEHGTDAASSQDRADRADRQESVSLLMPTIDRLVRESGLKKSDLNGIVVGVGPGGFTGVRVAVVTGRTLAQALKLPLVGINSLEIMSYGEPSENFDAPCGVIKEASKSHCFVARYARVFEGCGNGFYDLRALSAPAYVTTEVLASRLAQESDIHWYAEGSLLSRFPDLGLDRLKELASVNNVAVRQAKIAHVRLSLKEAGGLDPLEAFPYQSVQPLYLRGASVTLKKGDVIERVETH